MQNQPSKMFCLAVHKPDGDWVKLKFINYHGAALFFFNVWI